MNVQKPEALVHDIYHMAERLELDVDDHKAVRDILPEIREMRRSLGTLERELVDGGAVARGDAC